MRAIKGTWRAFGKITAICGTCLSGAALIFLCIWLATTNLSCGIWSLTLGINGGVWLLLGLAFLLRAHFENRKLGRLKRVGLRYDAKLEQIIRNGSWIRVGNLMSCYAECRYENKDGKACLVKSHSFIAELQNSQYRAVVYVNDDNMADYAVELSVAETEGVFAFDYRQRK